MTSAMTTPSPAFIARTRNPALIEVRPRETGKEIAARLRAGVKAEPIVRRPFDAGIRLTDPNPMERAA